jgi:hypothetical protein
MIRAIVRNKENTLLLDIPFHRTGLCEQLASIGIWNPQGDIFIRDNEDEKISVKLYSDSYIGNHLIRIFDESDTLSGVNLAVNMVMDADESIKSELEQNLLYDQYDSVKELLTDIRDMSENIQQDRGMQL